MMRRLVIPQFATPVAVERLLDVAGGAALIAERRVFILVS
jgi:hypothetical protein